MPPYHILASAVSKWRYAGLQVRVFDINGRDREVIVQTIVKGQTANLDLQAPHSTPGTVVTSLPSALQEAGSDEKGIVEGDVFLSSAPYSSMNTRTVIFWPGALAERMIQHPHYTWSGREGHGDEVDSVGEEKVTVHGALQLSFIEKQLYWPHLNMEHLPSLGAFLPGGGSNYSFSLAVHEVDWENTHVYIRNRN